MGMLIALVSGCGGAVDTPTPPSDAVGTAAPRHVRLELAPRSSAATRSRAVTIAGRVTRGSHVTVAGRRASVRAGRFHARVGLAVGRNRIEVVARKDGYAGASRTVTYRRRATPTPTPTPTPVPTPTATASDCDPNYTGACLDPNASDYDCKGGSGDGPEYTGPVTVVGDDHYDLDRDGDGAGCEG